MIDTKLLIEIFNKELERYAKKCPNLDVAIEVYALLPVYDKGYEDGYNAGYEKATRGITKT